MSDDHPEQLTALIEKYGADKACLAAAELDLQELNAAKIALEERIAYAEREFKRWQGKVEASRLAYNRRIDAQTDCPLNDEIVKARCQRALLVCIKSQFEG